MGTKKYSVLFSQSSLGDDGRGRLGSAFSEALAEYGPHLRKIQLGDELHQVRDLQRIGTVWQGTFAHLRPDAPHVVDRADHEREIPLGPDDQVLDKCHFLYRQRNDVLIWQVSRSAGGLVKLAQYLSELRGTIVNLPPICDHERLQEILAGQVYEIQFSYARPAMSARADPVWSSPVMSTMSHVDAARAQIRLTADRQGTLSQRVKGMIRSMISEPGYNRVKVRLTDETSLMDLTMAPMKELIHVPLVGRYPVPGEVFVQLEAAYDRKREQIQRQHDGGDD